MDNLILHSLKSYPLMMLHHKILPLFHPSVSTIFIYWDR